MKTAPMKFALVAGSALVASMFVSVETWAQGTSQERSACMGDAFRFCSADIPNVTKIEACLSQNRNSLTAACAAEFQPSQSTKLKPEHFRKD